jgi:site-specific DNA recombinase
LMFRSRYYLGVVTYEGVEYPGKHPALVYLTTFNQVEAMLGAHRLSGERTQKT